MIFLGSSLNVPKHRPVGARHASPRGSPYVLLGIEGACCTLHCSGQSRGIAGALPCRHRTLSPALSRRERENRVQRVLCATRNEGTPFSEPENYRSDNHENYLVGR
jgi:hypothetical protein